MYLAGTRVNMVSSPTALAEQVPGMTDGAGRGQPLVDAVLHSARPHRLVAGAAGARPGKTSNNWWPAS